VLMMHAGAYPWIAALGYKDEAGNVNYLCGGALVSKDFVVTASHCVNNRNDL
jgi:secreted trypsin-like serine protease